MRLARKGRSAALVLAVVLGVAAASPARAHDGGGANFEGAVGPYRVLAYDGTEGPNPDETEYVVIVQTSAGDAADEAEIDVVATRPGLDEPREPIATEQVANVHRYTLPDADTWQVALTVTGPAGDGTTQFDVHAADEAPALNAVAADEPRSPLWSLMLTASVVLLGTVAVLVWTRPRRPANA